MKLHSIHQITLLIIQYTSSEKINPETTWKVSLSFSRSLVTPPSQQRSPLTESLSSGPGLWSLGNVLLSAPTSQVGLLDSWPTLGLILSDNKTDHLRPRLAPLLPPSDWPARWRGRPDWLWPAAGGGKSSLSRDSGPTVGTLPVSQAGARIAPLAVKTADHSCVVSVLSRAVTLC